MTVAATRAGMGFRWSGRVRVTGCKDRRSDVRVDSPRLPVWFTWETNKKASGDNVVPENDSIVIRPPGTKITIYVDGERHDKEGEGTCPK
jgi:hypothetical protein